MSNSQEEMTYEDMQNLAVRQHKLITKLKGELANMIAISSEQQIIIDRKIKFYNMDALKIAEKVITENKLKTV